MFCLSITVFWVFHADTGFSMILIAALSLTIFHPGYTFPQMTMKNKHPAEGIMTEPKLAADVES